MEGELPYVYADNTPMSGIDPSGEGLLDDLVDLAAKSLQSGARVVAGFSSTLLRAGAQLLGGQISGAAEAVLRFCVLHRKSIRHP